MESILSKHHFWKRRLHSLSGVIPIGAFLLEHLFSNAYAFGGAEKFNDHVGFLLSIPQPFLALFEWGGIILPITFHAIYGIYLSRQGSVTAKAYPNVRNWMYVLQRTTGFLALGYMIVHLAQFRFGHGSIFLADPAFAKVAFEETAKVMHNPLWFTVYAVGLAATVFHFANGLCLFCYHWGLTISKTSQRAVALVAAGLGILLFGVGLASMAAFLK